MHGTHVPKSAEASMARMTGSLPEPVREAKSSPTAQHRAWAVNQRCKALGVVTGSCADSDDAANTLSGLAKAGALGSDESK